MAGLQGCTKSETMPSTGAPTTAVTTKAGTTTIVSHIYQSRLTGERTTYLPAFTTPPSLQKGGVAGSQQKELDCYEIYEAVIDPNTGKTISEKVIGLYCSGSGLDSDTGGGGSGGGGAYPTPVPGNYGDSEHEGKPSPCAANALVYGNESLVALGNNVRTATAQSQATGYAYTIESNGNIAAALLHPGPNQQEVLFDRPFRTGTTQPAAVHGMMSTHTAGMLSIFSVADLYNFYLARATTPGVATDLFSSQLYAANLPYDIAFSITTFQPASFDAFANRYLTTAAGRSDLANLYVNYNIRAANDWPVNRKGFVQLMKDLNSGIALSQGTNNIVSPSTTPNWSFVQLDRTGTETLTFCFQYGY